MRVGLVGQVPFVWFPPHHASHGPLQVHRYPAEVAAGGSRAPAPPWDLRACPQPPAGSRDRSVTSFDARFRNDETGAPAYPPALLLKVVLAAYAHGIVSSRGIERACQEHVTFIALCGDQAPHFTTIAHFVSTLGDDIARVFAAVVAICDAEGLIGREMFAIDGVKLPSNASKRRSGTRADFERQATKSKRRPSRCSRRHRATDTCRVSRTSW